MLTGIPEEPVTTVSRSREPEATAEKQRGVSLLDLLLLLMRARKLIGTCTLAVAVLASIVLLLMPNRYTAVARLMPPQQSQSSAIALLSQLNPLVASMGKDLLKNPSDLYVSILKSRVVADDLIASFNLQSVYDQKKLSDARERLASYSDISDGKDGLIIISVEDKDPKRAASMANAYVDELSKITQSLAVTEASQRRLFFERQLQTTKENLATAEAALKQSQETSGLLQLDGQAKAIIESVAALKAQLAAKEVQLERMRAFATEQNPDVASAKQELAGLREQLAKVEHSQVAGDGNLQVATSRMPAAGLEYVRRLRELKYQESLFEALAKQYEIAKIDETKNAVIIQVLDRAVEPDKRSRPKRMLIALICMFLAFIASCLYVALREDYARLCQSPAYAERVKLLLACFERRTRE